VGPRAAEIVRVLVFVSGTLVFALHQLQLGNDRGLVDGCFDSLVVVDQGPKDSSCVSLDLGVLVVGAQKGEQARQEIVILEEVDLVLSAVQSGVPDEQQDGTDELIQRAQAELTLCNTRLWDCWDIHGIQEEECKLKSWFNFENLPRTFIS